VGRTGEAAPAGKLVTLEPAVGRLAELKRAVGKLVMLEQVAGKPAELDRAGKLKQVKTGAALVVGRPKAAKTLAEPVADNLATTEPLPTLRLSLFRRKGKIEHLVATRSRIEHRIWPFQHSFPSQSSKHCLQGNIPCTSAGFATSYATCYP